MGLPFLDKKKIASMIRARRGKVDVETSQEEVRGDGEFDDMQSVAMDLLSAIERKSVSDIAEALRVSFAVCEEKMHEEAKSEALEPESEGLVV